MINFVVYSTVHDLYAVAYSLWNLSPKKEVQPSLERVSVHIVRQQLVGVRSEKE